MDTSAADDGKLISESKKKLYNVSDKQGDAESASLNLNVKTAGGQDDKNSIKNSNNLENIELVELKQQQQQQQTSSSSTSKIKGNNNNNNNINNYGSSRFFNFLYKTENILDLNLKFKHPLLEKHYKQAYLPVTRLLFTQYLFYLIVFASTWIIYYSISNSVASLSPTTTSFGSNNLTTATTATTTTTTPFAELNEKESAAAAAASSFVLVVLLIIFLLFLLTVFVFVLITEIKETRYRQLEKRMREQEMETKVNFEMAEKDVKLAMQEVSKKEKEYDSTKDELKSRYASVKKLRGIYSKIAYPVSIFTIIFMFFCCFASFAFEPKNLNQVSHFVWFAESLLLIYVIYPFEMLISIVLGVIFSIFYEILAIGKQTSISETENDANSSSSSQLIIFIFIKCMLHLSIHLIGIFVKISAQAIKRNTFLKVGHMHKAHMNAQQNKDITERMIKSIMPPLFTHVFGKPEEFKQSVDCEHQMRPLYIYPVSELSILFADIVGFTKMSSTKTAEELVYLLNDLYGRFDRLCEIAGCEKISTLGDCYYCVSGCLNGRQDHAKCCVEMGLLMVKEIEAFNKTHKVDVNMRVGVHTGKALCGFIGGKRFRFDVWSSDVTLANKMESTGKAGWVHISEDTYKQLQNKYNTEPADKYSGKSTYFVLREIKKETVADALKQSANKQDMLNASNNTVTLQSDLKRATNLDVADISDAGSQRLLNNSVMLDTTAGSAMIETAGAVSTATNNSNGKQNEPSILANPATDMLDEQSQLLMAVKEANFYRPDFNFFTMRFSKPIENKYKAFIIGLNNFTSLNARDRNTQMSFSSTDGNNIKAEAQQHQLTLDSKSRGQSSSSSSSKQLWTYPRNTIFFSVLVSFLINFLVSTAYLLSFIVSSMSYKDFKISSVYKIHFSVIFGLFAVFFVVQLTFLLFYLLQCTTFISKSTSKRTFLFDVPTILAKKQNKNEIYQSQISAQQQQQQPLPYQHQDPLQQRNQSTFKMNMKISKAVESHVTTRFYVLNLLASFLMSLIPTYVLLTSVSAANCINRKTLGSNQTLNLFTMYSYFCFIVSLIHFCSFVQLSSLIKTTIAFVFALTYGLVGFVGYMVNCETNRIQQASMNATEAILKTVTAVSGDSVNPDPTSSTSSSIKCSYYTYLFLNEFMDRNVIILIDFALLIFLIWLVNRQSDLVQRLSFKCDQDANQKVTYAKEQKELANWLIEVVLPSYVVDHVKEKRQYSKNYDSVGVLFVSLCNFGEFFEETYEGGRELLRILNEITVDFDRLFDDPKYKNIEKIKSIGSTFMIASGLNMDHNASQTSTNAADASDQQPKQLIHLYDLIDFAIELNQKLEAFNNEAMSVCHFKFKMRMGFNAGPVTAGVIGTERLLYDIWGDTVNVASRMDSTGEPGQLQLPEPVANLLSETYKFKYRGPVQVKGKDNMITYFMNPKENKPKMDTI